MKFENMSLQERIKHLRKNELHLTQIEFGNRLGAAGSTVTGWEKGDRIPPESTIKFICKEFHVNYIWLMEGIGDIFSSIDQTLVERLVDEYQLNDIQKRMIEAILELTDEQINMFTNKFFGFEVLKKENQED